jgi:hypothetical protein
VGKVTTAKIDSALIQAFTDLNLGLPTAYEGEEFRKSDKDDEWAEIHILPVITQVATLGVAGQDEHSGIMQIGFNVRPGTGRAALIGYCDTIRAEFFAGKAYSANDQEVFINSVDRSAIDIVNGWMHIDVSINWIARTIRPEG